MTFLYYVEVAIAKLILRLFTRRVVRGVENVPPEGPIIVVSNHLNLADPPLLAASIPRRIVFMAKEESFRHPLQGPVVRGFGAFPVRRGQLDRRALRSALRVLDEGLALGMFPEGRRSQSAQLQPGRSGTALVALRSGTPILPIGVTGTEGILGPALLFGRRRITVNIGQPFTLPPVDGRLTKAELTSAMYVIMGRVAELLPQEYRGHYADREGS
ncbi:MAG: lysophospholipid acyltransferase family protein [Chloroflexota bacterium]